MRKNINGAGMDPLVIGRPTIQKPAERPHVRHLFVPDLTPGSEGNAIGIGFADLTAWRLVRKIDHAARTRAWRGVALVPRAAPSPGLARTRRRLGSPPKTGWHATILQATRHVSGRRGRLSASPSPPRGGPCVLPRVLRLPHTHRALHGAAGHCQPAKRLSVESTLPRAYGVARLRKTGWTEGDSGARGRPVPLVTRSRGHFPSGWPGHTSTGSG